MARGALGSARTAGKLSAVRIGLVAVHALLENQRLLEVSAGVALHTIHAGVLAPERKLCFGMVEALVQSCA